MSNVKNTGDILSALLSTEVTREKDVPMPRFGVDFRIKSISVKERADAREKATKTLRNGETQFDSQLFTTVLIQKGTVSPDFSAQELRDKFGPTTYDVIQNLLLPGEYDRLGSEILDISGYGDEAEAIEDIKN